MSADDFCGTKRDWILTHDNPAGFHLWVNLRRNCKATVNRCNNHMNPNLNCDGGSVLLLFSCASSTANTSFACSTGNCPAGFLEEVGAPGLPQRNPPNLNIRPGGDDEEEEEDEDGDEDLPAQVPHAAAPRARPPVIEVDDDKEEEEQAEVDPVQEAIDEVADQLTRTEMAHRNNPSGTLVMGTFAVVAPAVLVHGVDHDHMQNAIVLGALLGPGTDASAVDLDLN